MTARKFFQLFVIAAVLATSFFSTGSALASGNCPSYVTVQWGDTLSGIAAACGTTVDALYAANPSLGWWLYAGQVLYIPSGYAPAPAAPSVSGTYTIQWGDTLGDIAVRQGVSLSSLLAVNPQIWNVNLIYPGQAINLPSASVTPPAYYPPAVVTPAADLYKTLKITYGYGMVVRTGPGKDYEPIHSSYVSAVYDSEWKYRTNSTTIDSSGYVWVEVTLHPMAPYSVGWILVRDTLGKYYTSPLIDP